MPAEAGVDTFAGVLGDLPWRSSRFRFFGARSLGGVPLTARGVGVAEMSSFGWVATGVGAAGLAPGAAGLAATGGGVGTAGDGAVNAWGEASGTGVGMPTGGPGAVGVAGVGVALDFPAAAAAACCFWNAAVRVRAIACSNPKIHARYAAIKYCTALFVVCVGILSLIPGCLGSATGDGRICGTPLAERTCVHTGCSPGLGICIN